jgi:hypothetical protein
MTASWLYLSGGVVLLLNAAMLNWVLRRRQAPRTFMLRAILWLQGATGAVLVAVGIIVRLRS